VRLIAPALAQLSAEIARLTAELGRRVEVAAIGATDRRGQLKLSAPGRFSANRACGLFRAADGWIAVNLARDEDRELIPAWLGSHPDEDPWAALAREARRRPAADLIEGAALLGLPADAADGQATTQQPPRAAARSRPLGALGRSALRRGAGGDGRRGDQDRERWAAGPHARLDARLLPAPERPQDRAAARLRVG
jgi:hypothetical protein